MDGRVKIKYNFMSIVKDNCRTTHNWVCLTVSQTTPARTLSFMKICFEMAHSSKTVLIKAIELQGLHSYIFFHHTFRNEPTSYNVKDPLHLQTHWSSTGFSTHTSYVLPLHLSWLHLSFSLSWLSIKSHFPTLWQPRFLQITSCLASIST